MDEVVKVFSKAATGAGDHVNAYLYRNTSALTPDADGIIATNEGPMLLKDGDYAFKPGIKDMIMWDAVNGEWVNC